MRFSLAAALGLLALAPSGRAAADDAATVAQWEDALLDRAPLTPEERLAHAQAVLREDRFRRVETLHQRALEAAWRVWLNASPNRIWKGMRRVASGVWKFNDRGPVEDEALAWIELGLPDPQDTSLQDLSLHDLPLQDLYGRLRVRERQELSESRVAGAQKALDQGRFEVARPLLERALVLEPESKAALNRLAELQQRERAAAVPDSELSVHSWDVPLAEALLVGDYEAALTMVGPDDPDTQFVRAAAQMLQGERDSALAAFTEIEADGGALGAMAAQWLERPEIDVDGKLTHAVRQYRMKRVLGWIGGNALAERGSGLTSTSFRVWKASLTPMNIALSLPARVIRGWKPDGRDVREAAVHYLEEKPHGASAETAREWLDQVGWPKTPDPSSFESVFQLPPVQTPYARLGITPIVVSRRAVDSGYISSSPALRSALEGSSAVWLEARKTDDIENEDGFALSPAEARLLMDQLAFAVEQSELRWSLRSRDAALERLRRMDGAVASGWVLFAEPWSPGHSGAWSSLASTVFDGKEQTGSFALERGTDDIVAARILGDEVRECPRDTLCLDRDGAVRTTLFGYLDMSSGGGLGFQTAAGRTGVSLAMTQDGPEASLVLPIGRWLHIDTWLPIEAEFTVGAQSFYIGPVLRKTRCSDDADTAVEESGARELLPIGLRSRCVLRMY